VFKGPHASILAFAPFAAGLVVALGACGGRGAEEAAPPKVDVAPNIVQAGAPGEQSRTLSLEALGSFEPPRYVAADVAFMQGMIHHHAQALRMTRLVPRRSAGSQIPLLAERMDISQVSEIEQMQRWLIDRHKPAPVLHRGHGHAHGIGQGTAMPGMLSETQLLRLQHADGLAFNRLFLESMIRHHRGALTMVRQLYAAGGGAEPESDAFARHVFADQTIEIERMEGMLAELR
jgi:uncharacterized protein (DUF305 family)